MLRENRMIKLGVVMDPISSINVKKDSSLAMLIEAQHRGYEIHYMEMSSLYLRKNKARASTQRISVKYDFNQWYSLDGAQDIELGSLDVILMRKDPPINTEFIYATYILEMAEAQGTIVVNKPQSLRDYNEKLINTKIAHHAPDTLVSRQANHIRAFCQEHEDIIIKPLDSMGGHSVFRIKKDDPNLSVIIETLTSYGQNFCIVQNFLPAIKDGDKRILVIDGKPVPYCLARIPKSGETRGNLAAGGRGEVRPISKEDLNIINDVSPILKKNGLIFVGLDIIGDRLTEINITSPTCIREIEAIFPISITGMLMDAIEQRILMAKG